MFLSRHLLVCVSLLSGCSNVLDLSGEVFNGAGQEDAEQMIEDTSPDPPEEVSDPLDIGAEVGEPDAPVEDVAPMDLVESEPDAVDVPEVPRRLCRIGDWAPLIPTSGGYPSERLDGRQILPTIALSADGTRVMVAWQDTESSGSAPKFGSLGWVILDDQGVEQVAGVEDSPRFSSTFLPRLTSDRNGFLMTMLGEDTQINDGEIYRNRHAVTGEASFVSGSQPALYGGANRPDVINLQALDFTSQNDLAVAVWNQTVDGVNGVNGCGDGEDEGEVGCIKIARLRGEDAQSFLVERLEEPCRRARVDVAMSGVMGAGLVVWEDCEGSVLRWRTLDEAAEPGDGFGSVSLSEEDDDPTHDLLAFDGQYILALTIGDPLNVFALTLDSLGGLIAGPDRVEEDSQEQGDPVLLSAAGAPTLIYAEDDDLEMSRLVGGQWVNSPDPLDGMGMVPSDHRAVAAQGLRDGRVLIVVSVHFNGEPKEDLVMAFFEGCPQ